MIYLEFNTNKLMGCMFPVMMDEMSSEVIYNLYNSMGCQKKFFVKYKGYRFIHRFCWNGVSSRSGLASMSSSDLYGIEFVLMINEKNEKNEICQKFWMHDCDWMCGSHYATTERIEFNWYQWIKRTMDKLRNGGRLKKEIFEKDEYYVETSEIFKDEIFS